MNALSATRSATAVTAATAAAAFSGMLVLAMLSRVAPLPTVPDSHRPSIVPVAALLPAAPLLDDCAPFAPAPLAPDTSGRLTLIVAANGDARGRDAAAPDDRNDGGCDPDGGTGFSLGREIGGLGSGWIISADGVMRMNPYSLSDTHSIAVRPAEPLREFKGRVLGLGHGGTMPHGAQPVPEGKERRPLLVVDNRVAPPAGQAGSAVAGAADERGRRGGFAAFAFAATAEASFPTRRARV